MDDGEAEPEQQAEDTEDSDDRDPADPSATDAAGAEPSETDTEPQRSSDNDEPPEEDDPLVEEAPSSDEEPAADEEATDADDTTVASDDPDLEGNPSPDQPPPSNQEPPTESACSPACGDDEPCIDGVCRRTCEQKNDCGAEQDCVGGACVPCLISGGCQPTCSPTMEVCDGADNDCDDQIDESGVCGCEGQPTVTTIATASGFATTPIVSYHSGLAVSGGEALMVYHESDNGSSDTDFRLARLTPGEAPTVETFASDRDGLAATIAVGSDGINLAWYSYQSGNQIQTALLSDNGLTLGDLLTPGGDTLVVGNAPTILWVLSREGGANSRLNIVSTPEGRIMSFGEDVRAFGFDISAGYPFHIAYVDGETVTYVPWARGSDINVEPIDYAPTDSDTAFLFAQLVDIAVLPDGDVLVAYTKEDELLLARRSQNWAAMPLLSLEHARFESLSLVIDEAERAHLLVLQATPGVLEPSEEVSTLSHVLVCPEHW